MRGAPPCSLGSSRLPWARGALPSDSRAGSPHTPWCPSRALCLSLSVSQTPTRQGSLAVTLSGFKPQTVWSLNSIPVVAQGALFGSRGAFWGFSVCVDVDKALFQRRLVHHRKSGHLWSFLVNLGSLSASRLTCLSTPTSLSVTPSPQKVW